MENSPVNAVFMQFGAVILFSLLLGGIAARLGLPAVVGYLVAGLALGPQGLGVVTSHELIDYLSELGVLLLLFYMGLEISWSKFSRAGFYALFLSPIKSGIGFALGFLVAKVLGLPTLIAFVFGASLAVSSTAIISQIIIDRHWERALEAQIAMAMLILEDIFSVFVIAYLLGAHGGISVGKILFNSVMILFVLFVIGTRLSRRFLSLVMKYGKPENFSLYAFATLLIFSYGVSYFGMSPLLGAFFAGMVLSETVHARKIEEELSFFRRLFVILFFTALGLKYTISFGPLALKLTLAGLVVLLLQRLAIVIFGPVFGLSPRSAAKLAVIMFPLGEFSLFTAAAMQSLDFHDPVTLHYFGLTPEVASSIPVLSAELMGATFALIVFTTLATGLIFRKEEEIEQKLSAVIPNFVFSIADSLRFYFTVTAKESNVLRSRRFALFLQKKTQRIIEYILVIIVISYLMGYGASLNPDHALIIYLMGYVLAAFPLAGIVLAFYAVMSRYADELVRMSGFPQDYRRKLARSIAYVFVGIVLFVAGLAFLAMAEGLNVLTLFLFSFLLIAASVGLAAYGVIQLLQMFMVPIPPNQTRHPVRSGRQ